MTLPETRVRPGFMVGAGSKLWTPKLAHPVLCSMTYGYIFAGSLPAWPLTGLCGSYVTPLCGQQMYPSAISVLVCPIPVFSRVEAL